MNRKLLDGSCVVFGAAVFVKLAIYLSPWFIRVPHDFSPFVSAIMLLSGGLSLSLATYLLFKSGIIIRRKRLFLAAASALIVASVCTAIYIHQMKPNPIPHLSSKDVEVEAKPVK